METWVVPCNVKKFDLVSHFETSETVVWKKSRNIEVGDLAYLYVGAPYSEVKYVCEVIANHVDADIVAVCFPYAFDKRSMSSEYMELKRIKTFPDGTFPLAELKLHGLGQVQTQARADRALKRFISLHMDGE